MKYILICIIYIGFSSGAYADWTFIPYPSDKPVENIITSIAVDHDGVIWISSGYDLWTMKNNLWQNHSKEITTLIKNGIHDILVGNDNTKWFASADYTTNPFVFSFDGVAWKQYPFLTYVDVQGVPPSQCPVYQINKIALDKDNVLWFAGYGGVIQLNPDLSWIVYYQNGNFGNTSIFNHAIVYSVAVDPDNVKWFGISSTDYSMNKGLASYDGISWKLYNQANVPVAGQNISNIACGMDGSIIINANNGMYLYKNSFWRKIESLYGPNLFSPAADKKGGFWLLVYDSLHKPFLFGSSD